MTLPTQEGLVAAEEIQGAEFEAEVEGEAEELAPEEVGAEDVTTELAPDTTEDDAPDWQGQFEAAQGTIEKLQGNIGTLKSTHDRSTYQMQQEFERREEVTSDRLAELEVRDMDDDQKVIFLQNRELEKLDRRDGKLDEREWNLQQRESMLAWDDYFLNRVGIDPKNLRRDVGFEDFHSSGWQGIELLVTDLRTRNTQLEAFITESKLQIPGAPKVVKTAVGKKPPKVQTKVPGSPPGKKRMADLKDGEREEHYAAFEAGEIAEKDMPV